MTGLDIENVQTMPEFEEERFRNMRNWKFIIAVVPVHIYSLIGLGNFIVTILAMVTILWEPYELKQKEKREQFTREQEAT